MHYQEFHGTSNSCFFCLIYVKCSKDPSISCSQMMSSIESTLCQRKKLEEWKTINKNISVVRSATNIKVKQYIGNICYIKFMTN